MKIATIHQVPQQWPEILRWLAAGEEVQLMEQDQIVARVLPAGRAATPDFLRRAKAVWGAVPVGKVLSEVVLQARGENA